MSENAKNIVGMFRHQASGCFWYRTKHPFDMFVSNGVNAKMLEIETDIEFYDRLKSVQLYGIYPFQFYKALETMKADGIKIIYDMDDAVDLIDENNPFYYSVKKDAKSSLEILKYADHITVSTSVMASLLANKTDKPITVIPNCYIPSEWTYPRPQREGIRIGFAGSCTHVADLIQVLPIISKLQKSHDVRFLIMGFGKQSYEEWYRDFLYTATPEAIKQLETLNSLMKEINFEWVPYVDYTNYPSTLINMALDIGICPLLDTPFNQARSACKAMEYTLAGALALASDSAPYRSEPTSTLVEDWDKALTYFVEHPQEIKDFQLKNLRWIEDNRKVDSQLEILKKIYEI
jgi:glycosyltransferase involved in cell wall biosynthesis